VIAAQSPTVSVIIVNWNGAHFLRRCLQSLRGQTQSNVQVILADNGSADDSVALTREQFPEVDIIEFGQNLGYAEANNRAATMSKATYLFFLNNDTYLDPAALSTLVATAESKPNIPIWAPRQKTYDGKRLMHVGLSLDVVGYPCDGTVLYADGSCLFIRRTVFEELGGFDAWHFMFFEDADLCWRAWVYGYAVGQAPDAVVYHHFGGTAGPSIAGDSGHETNRTKRRLGHRNQLATVYKNYSTPLLCVIVPLLTVLTAAEVAVLALTGQRSAIEESYLPAWRDLWHARASLRARRRTVQRARRVSDRVVLHRMRWTLVTVGLFLRIGVPKIT